MTKITIKTDLFRGTIAITDDGCGNGEYEVRCNNFESYTIDAPSIQDAVGITLASVGTFKRSPEFIARQAILSAKRSETMKKTHENLRAKPVDSKAKPALPVARTA